MLALRWGYMKRWKAERRRGACHWRPSIPLRAAARSAFDGGDIAGVSPVADDWLWGHGYDLPEGSEDRRRVLVEFAS